MRSAECRARSGKLLIPSPALRTPHSALRTGRDKIQILVCRSYSIIDNGLVVLAFLLISQASIVVRENVFGIKFNRYGVISDSIVVFSFPMPSRTPPDISADKFRVEFNSCRIISNRLVEVT